VEQLYKNGQIIHLKSTTVHHVNFALQPGATISGHLRAPDGGNPEDTYLGVDAYTVESDGKTHGYANLLSNTDSGGYFQISKMSAGTYMLLVTDDDTPQNYGQQWYPDASMASAGTPITVTTGEQVVGKDMTLSTPGTLNIQTLYGTHSAQSQVELRDADGRWLGSAKAMRTVESRSQFCGRASTRSEPQRTLRTAMSSGTRTSARLPRPTRSP
jgi:hypothetical protein